MFLLRSTNDHDRSRTATATAAQALRQYARMSRDGLAPRVTDLNGRAISPAELRYHAVLQTPARLPYLG